MLKQLFYSECILLLRRSQEWLYPLGFFTMFMCLFPLALSPDPIFLQKIMPGCVWLAALLASLLSITHVFYTELEEGGLEQLLLSPTPLSLLLLAKLSAQWLVTELPIILLTPILASLFHLPFTTTLLLCLSLLIGTPILTLLGSLLAALTIGLRQQGVILGLLLLPLIVPVLIFAVNIVQQAEAGFSMIGPIAFLAGMLFLAITLLPIAIAATLRISVDD